MKVAISSSGTTLESNVDPRFGRCPYFIIYDTDSGIFSYIENQERQATEGGGIKVAQMILNMKVDSVITGNIGPNAYGVLSAALIEVYSGVSGTVKNAINRFKNGELESASEPDVPPYSGTGSKWDE